MTDALPPPPGSWYHTLPLPSGTTEGFFDLTRMVGDVPWPDLTGKRCLDVATYDGMWAFEMERRGAAEVIALDVERSSEFDWVPRRRDRADDQPTGAGFHHAAAALGSTVKRVTGNVYTLDPDDLGTFDVVIMGSLMPHLRAPLAALERVRNVCAGIFISMEPIDIVSTLLLPSRPVMAITPGYNWVWATPNRAGHRGMLETSGFEVLSQHRSVLEYGDAVPEHGRQRSRRLLRRAGVRLMGTPDLAGLPASIVTARPLRGLDDRPQIATRSFG